MKLNDTAWPLDKVERLHAAIQRVKRAHNASGQAKQSRFAKKFAAARTRINASVLDDFKQHEWPRFQMLDEIFTKEIGLPVPTLSVCGHGTAEIRFTKLLTYFFDSRNRHGLKGLLVRAVFEDRIQCGNQLSFDDCTAKAEVSLGESSLSNGQQVGNSLDIEIEVGEHKILIEQKINSAQGQEQLPRYSDGMRRTYGESAITHRFFLTPEGKAGDDEQWESLSHRQLLLSMASVLDRHILSGTARHNLRAFLWDLLLGPLAQDIGWMDELKRMTGMVARDPRKYIEMKRWFGRYGLGREELRIVAKLIGE